MHKQDSNKGNILDPQSIDLIPNLHVDKTLDTSQINRKRAAISYWLTKRFLLTKENPKIDVYLC